jgi:hypothetical protein
MELPSRAPNEKVQVPLLIIALLVVLTLGLSLVPASWLGVEKKVVRYAPLNLGTLASVGNAENDADKDGTVSWKEFVSGSLGISADREATTTVEIDSRDLAALNDPNNLTSSFTKNLYIASTVLQQSGINDEKTQQETVSQLIAKEAAKIRPASYTASSVKVGSDSSVAALKKYGNAVASILDGLITEKTLTDDLVSVTTYIQSENEGDLLPVVRNAKALQVATDKLLALTVPKVAVSVHVDVLNRIATFATNLEDLSRAHDDPIRATLAFEKYTDVATEAVRATPLMAEFLNSQNVVFSSKEAGYLFTGGYTNK